jgi:branched-chain amino acid transport system ATP-binding protein
MSAPDLLPALLELRGVDAFYGRAHILADISLQLGAGEVAVLMGRNGAGKSTTLKSIIGLVPVAKGEILFQGERIEGLPAHDIVRRGLGYVPEDRRIFSGLTVRENLEVGRRPPRASQAAWNEERLFALFPNLADMRERPAGRMSGGEQQMLAIARTLMGNPLCVLLDEPSEGLAPLIVEQMAAAVMEMKAAGLSVLLSEQNLYFAARVADRAYIIEQGRIRFSGSVQDIMSDEGVRSAYLAV